MAVPKKRTSKAKKRARKANWFKKATLAAQNQEKHEEVKQNTFEVIAKTIKDTFISVHCNIYNLIHAYTNMQVNISETETMTLKNRTLFRRE